jgi:regulatory protein
MNETGNHKVTDVSGAGIISALKVQKRNPQRVNVYLDGEFAFGLARITAAWLHVGQQLSNEKIAQLKAQDTQEAAYQRALRLLSFRPRSSAEIRQKLTRLGYTEEIIDNVLGRLVRSGLIDDTRFAKEWAENRNEFRPRSRRALEYELRQHGLAREEIDQALEGLDENSLALQAARKHARKLHGLPATDFRRKLYGFLARRGFGYETAKPAVEQAWRENGQQDNVPPTPDNENEEEDQ